MPVRRLYHADAPDVPEQEHQAAPDVDLSAAINPAVAFCFGPSVGWTAFSVFVLTRSGAVYGLCPVLPYSAYACSASAV